MLNKGISGYLKKLPAYNRLGLYALLLLLIISFLTYNNLLFAGFLDYDDIGNLVQNLSITDFSITSIKTIFTTSVYYSYNPITFLSYALEYQLFGMSSAGFHFTNILLHLLNIFLVFRFVSLLVKDKGIALVSAALFALHPMHADVVGWISARSYLLGTLFFLLSLIYYIQYHNSSPKKNAKIILSLLFFAFACLSKSQAITLAPVILLINWLFKSKYDLRQIIIVSIFFCISITTGLLTIYFRTDIGKTEIIPEYSFIDKVFVISFSIVKYIYKVIYPSGLTAIESFPAKSANGSLPLMAYISPVLILITLICMWIFRKKGPIIIFGLLFFFLNVLVTQISFLEDGFCANRYFYLSSIGIYLALAVLCIWIYKKAASHKYWLITGGLILLIFLAGITYSRSGNWKNTFSLSSSIIENSPDVTMAYNMRGVWHYTHHEYERSIQDFNKAISIFPSYSSAYYNRGLSLVAMQNFTSALKDYDRAIELNQNFVSAYNARGVLMLDVIKDYPRALDDFNKAVSLDPVNAKAYYNRGLAYFRMRNVDEACKNWFRVKALGYAQADNMIAKYCK